MWNPEGVFLRQESIHAVEESVSIQEVLHLVWQERTMSGDRWTSHCRSLKRLYGATSCFWSSNVWIQQKDSLCQVPSWKQWGLLSSLWIWVVQIAFWDHAGWWDSQPLSAKPRALQAKPQGWNLSTSGGFMKFYIQLRTALIGLELVVFWFAFMDVPGGVTYVTLIMLRLKLVNL